MGRQKRESDEALINDVDNYLKEVEEAGEIPQVIRYARRHGLTKQALYLRTKQNQDLLDSIKRIVDEKELVLEERALTGQYNSSMAIFSLKQIGWRDKIEFEDENKNEIKVTIQSDIAEYSN